jgi:DNA-binding beta-propeller fold protein YncE
MRLRDGAVLAVVTVAIIGVVMSARRGDNTSLIRALTLNQNPIAVVVDTGAGHAIVAVDSGLPSASGHALILDDRTGALLRTVDVGHELSALAIDEQTARVYVADNAAPSGQSSATATLYMLDEQSGRVSHHIALDAPIVTMVMDNRSGRLLTLSRGAIVNGAYGIGTVAVRDAAMGTTLSTGTAGMYPTSIVIDAHSQQAFIANLLGNSVSVLDARNGHTRAAITLGPPPGRVVAVAVDTRAKHVFALSLPPTIAGGPQPTRGGLAMIDLATGRLTRTIALRNPAALAVDERTGRVLVAADGSVQVRDGASGRLLRTIATGVNPSAMAVDGRSGRAILIRGDGAARDPDAWAWVPGWLRARLPFVPRPSIHFHAIPAGVSIFDLAH